MSQVKKFFANNLPYITKPFDRETLLKKVNVLLKDGTYAK